MKRSWRRRKVDIDAAGAIAKGLAAKASVPGAKAIVGHHGHYHLAHQIAGKLAEKLTDSAVDEGLSKKEKESAAE